MTPDITVEPSPPETDSDRGERIRLADLSDIHLDRTLVLIGCGAAKRDPEDPADRHLAVRGPDEPVPTAGPDATGPAWRAKDLYTSTYFGVKRQFAKTVTQWAGSQEGTEQGWAILSAEHHVVGPYLPLCPYDTTVDDLGDDPSDPDHRIDMRIRQPSGAWAVTELDKWAAFVGLTLGRWLAEYHDPSQHAPGEYDVDTLLVLAGRDYIEPLREREAFRWGASRMLGDPNHCGELDLNVRYLFEEIDAEGIGEQMAWLSDAVDRIDEALPDARTTEQADLATWAGDDRQCVTCGVAGADADLTPYGGDAYCRDHEPIGQCSRCGQWTTESGLGTYPLCEGCQTETGGQKRAPVDDTPDHEQRELVATDGGGE